MTKSAIDSYKASDNEIVKEFGGMVISIAKKSYGRTRNSYGLELEDFIQSGMLALINCIPKYDPNKGVKLVTYAYRSVEHGMIDTTRRADKFSAHLRHQTIAIAESKKTLGPLATVKALSLHSGVPVKAFAQVEAALVSEKSLSLVGGYDEDEGKTNPTIVREGEISDPTILTPDEQLDIDQRHERLNQAVRLLSDRAQTVIKLRWTKEMSFDDIAKVVGVGRARVKKDYATAVDKIERLYKGERVEPYLPRGTRIDNIKKKDYLFIESKKAA